MKKLVLLGVLMSFSVFAATLNLTNLPTTVDSGAFVGFATGHLTGGPILQLECIDFFENTSIPSSFSVTVNNYDTAAAPTWIKQIDYLLRTETASTIAVTQWAIWNIIAPATPDHGSAGLVSSVQAMNLSLYIPHLQLYTPNHSDDQRFVSITATPEPATLGMVGLVLLGVGLLRKKLS